MTANTFTNAQCLAEALAISGLAEGIDTLLFEAPDIASIRDVSFVERTTYFFVNRS